MERERLKNTLARYWDALTGREARLREMYHAFFSGTGAEAFALESKKTNRTVMGGALLALVLVIVLWVSEAAAGRQATPGVDLTRPSPYESARTVDLELEAVYKGETVSGSAGVRIRPRELGKAEAEAEILRIAHSLPAAILAANTSLDSVNSDLHLPSSDTATGADISWKSGNARIVSDEGKVNLIGTTPEEPVTLIARIRLGESSDDIAILLRMGAPAGGPEEVRAALERRIEEEVQSVSDSIDGDEAVLPEVTNDGVQLSWRPRGQAGHLPELLICIGVVFLVFWYRYRAARKKIDEARDEMERDFPDFIAKLGLLLGAGLVITSAIGRITDDYLETKDLRGERRLYEELSSLRERMRAGNTPLVREITDLARRSELREIARFASVLADNIDKGNALAEKLRQESELLWDGRKKRAEKLGHIAETKLVFPMVLQILCVIVVTVMPAAFEMS
ncbi:hypothetical protein AGMMS49983_18070 [Clostridia bacterium]|nr:hypothetical protein AGMMS49983_18070 [Clostridia bacterium]